jgi:glycerate dehydrogenase
MKIVCLDGYTLNPGDLSWQDLEKLGEVTIYDRTGVDQVVRRAIGAEALLTNKCPIRAETIAALPDLRYIGVLATGYNIVDVRAARERGIPVTNVPEYGTHSVAQMVFALLLHWTQRVCHHADTVRHGRWSACEDFSYWDHPLVELHGRTMGLVGFGRIGQAVAAIARAFGMHVLAYDVRPIPEESGVEQAELDRVFAESDVVSLHTPLTPETEKMVDADRLLRMKRTAILINTSRGQIIDETALADALNAGRIAAAGLDVLSVEPPPADNSLLRAQNVILTPHIAWATQAARQRLLQTVADNLRSFQLGCPQNVVN